MRDGVLWYRCDAHTPGQLLGLTEDTGTVDTEYRESWEGVDWVMIV